MITLPKPTHATTSALGEKASVRELINALLDIDSSKTVVLSYEKDNESNIWRAVYAGNQTVAFKL